MDPQITSNFIDPWSVPENMAKVSPSIPEDPGSPGEDIIIIQENDLAVKIDDYSEALVNCERDHVGSQSGSSSSLDGLESSSVPEMAGIIVPSAQQVVITPEVCQNLNLHLRTIPVRAPSEGEVLVRILYSGICRSDGCFSVGPEPGFSSHNHIAGHEGIGHIVKCHERSLLGRLVALRYLGTSCGACTYCLRGIPTSCPSQLNSSKHITGTFQQYATVPLSCVMFLPQDLGLERTGIGLSLYTAALCSGSTALMALRAANVRPGDVVVVVGIAGAIGHLTGAIAKQVMSAKVIGVDLGWKIKALEEEFEDFADKLVAAPGAEDPAAWANFKEKLILLCSQLRNTSGSPRAAECVIVSSSSFAGFMNLDEYVCDGGHVVCVGVPRGDNRLSIPLNALVERNLHFSGTLMGSHSVAMEVMRYIESGLINVKVTEVSLPEVPVQLQKLVDCEVIGKVVVRINGPI